MKNLFNKLFLALIVSVVAGQMAFADDEQKRGLNWQGAKKTSIESSILKGNYRALIIGNDQYMDKGGVWNSLETASRDAESVANVLDNKYGF